jgi:hypothetical protein
MGSPETAVVWADDRRGPSGATGAIKAVTGPTGRFRATRDSGTPGSCPMQPGRHCCFASTPSCSRSSSPAQGYWPTIDVTEREPLATIPGLDQRPDARSAARHRPRTGRNRGRRLAPPVAVGPGSRSSSRRCPSTRPSQSPTVDRDVLHDVHALSWNGVQRWELRRRMRAHN